MFGLATLGGIMTSTKDSDVKDTIPGFIWGFLASGIGTMIAAWTGSTPIIVCVECASGVREGGRTGLTAVVIGLYFVLSIFLAPLFSAVPESATAPVLVLVGVMMMGESGKIPWESMNDALPAFLTIILMPLTYSITNGMIFGLLTGLVMYFTCGLFYDDPVHVIKHVHDIDNEADDDRLLSNRYSSPLVEDDNEKPHGLIPAQTGLQPLLPHIKRGDPTNGKTYGSV
jgi:xanthine/uracil/vitamin C permease (AzgA family)